MTRSKQRQIERLRHLQHWVDGASLLIAHGARGDPTGRPIRDIYRAMTLLRKRVALTGYNLKWTHYGAGHVHIIMDHPSWQWSHTYDPFFAHAGDKGLVLFFREQINPRPNPPQE